LKDIIVRSRQMAGFDAVYVPGWDCHGLPIEHNVDKELGAEKSTLSMVQVRKRCRRYAEKFIDIQREEFKRLGVMGEWDNPYLTMNFAYEATIARECGKFALDGSLFKSKKPIYWCNHCQTALAEAEIEYYDAASPSIYVKFALQDDLGASLPVLAGRNVFLVIWTTTPWTIPANLAVALHPDFDYVAVDTRNGEILILARELVPACMRTFGFSDYDILAAITPRDLERKRCRHPLYDRDSLIVLGDHVTLDAGTGCVHTGLRRDALEAIRATRWLPEWGQARIRGMVENRPDWCISRQRNWGVPIPLFVHRDSGRPHPRTPELLEAVARRVEEAGIEAWFALDPAELLGSEAADYLKLRDTLDVWFDSGVTHFAVSSKRPELGFPADLYLEGSDQHRGWFQSSLLTSVAMQGHAPYRAVLTHGFTVDEKGEKMSKSRGNVVAPQEVVSTLGADILRLWVAATDFSAEMAISQGILERTADAYRRIRNTARFLLANLNGFDPERDALGLEDLLPLDRWIIDRAFQVQQQVVGAYDDYQFHQIYQRLHNFCSVELGSFYLDVIKDRQYTTRSDSHARRSAQTALHHVAEALTRWMAPILSFTAEEIWQLLPGKRPESVLFSTWYDGLQPLDPEAVFTAGDWDRILEVRTHVARAIEGARNEQGLGGSLNAEIDLYIKDDLLAGLLERLGDELRFVLITSDARVLTVAPPAGAAQVTLDDGRQLAIVVRASAHAKCVRCWHRRPDVGLHPEHPELCGRCVDNVTGPGEKRRFA
jgi:isoleucyl-tRNA synthetase